MTARHGLNHMPRSRLYRDPDNGFLFGVCAGLADYFGFDLWVVRLITVFGFVFFTLPTMLIYFGAAALLERKPDDLYADPQEARFWQGVRRDPDGTAHLLRHRFRELEKRLRRIEACITSQEFKLSRDIDDLGR